MGICQSRRSLIIWSLDIFTIMQVNALKDTGSMALGAEIKNKS